MLVYRVRDRHYPTYGKKKSDKMRPCVIIDRIGKYPIIVRMFSEQKNIRPGFTRLEIETRATGIEKISYIDPYLLRMSASAKRPLLFTDLIKDRSGTKLSMTDRKNIRQYIHKQDLAKVKKSIRSYINKNKQK